MIVYQGKFPTSKKLKNSIISTIKDKLLKIKRKLSINLFDLYLILNEAIINAMEHGNKWYPAKNIIIKIFLHKTGFRIEIEDEGQGFDYCHEFLKHHLSKRGGGLFLIRQICDIEWTDCGKILKINIPVEISA